MSLAGLGPQDGTGMAVLVRMQGPGTPGWHQRSWCGHDSGQGWGCKCDHGDLMVMELTGLGTLVWTQGPLELEVLGEPCCGHGTGSAVTPGWPWEPQ